MPRARTSVGEAPAEPSRVDPRIEQTRQRVFGATIELMAEHGDGPLTVERIAERSGVARSTIYRRWPDLATLCFEAFVRLPIRRTTPPTGDTPHDLRVYVRELVDRLNDPLYFAVIVHLMANAARSARYAQLHLELFGAGSNRGAAVFVAGQRSGMVRPDVDVELASDVLRYPLVFTRLALHERIDVERALADVPAVMRRFGTAKGLAAMRRAERLTAAG